MKSIKVEQLEEVFSMKNGKHFYALVIYDPAIADDISKLEVDADFVLALPDNGRGDLREEIPKGGYRVFFD